MKNISISHLNLSPHQNEIITTLLKHFEREEQLIDLLYQSDYRDYIFPTDYNPYTFFENITTILEDDYSDENISDNYMKYYFILRLIYSELDKITTNIPETLHTPSRDIIDDKDIDDLYTQLIYLFEDDFELINLEIDI